MICSLFITRQPGAMMTCRRLLMLVAAVSWLMPCTAANKMDPMILHNKLAQYLQQLQVNNYFILTDDNGEPLRNATWSDYWELIADSRKRLLANEIADSLRLENDDSLDDAALNQVITWPGVRAQLAEVASFNENALKGLPGGAGRWLRTPQVHPFAGQESELVVAEFEGAKPSDFGNSKNGTVPTWRYTYSLDLTARDCPVTEATLHLTIRGVGGDGANERHRRAQKLHRHQRNYGEQDAGDQHKLFVEIGTQFYTIFEAPVTQETHSIKVPITELVRLWESSPRHWRSGHQVVITSPLMPNTWLPIAIVESNATKLGPYVEVKYSQKSCRRSKNTVSIRPRRGVQTLPTPNNEGRIVLSTNGAASFVASPFLGDSNQETAMAPSPDCTAGVNKIAGHTMCCRKEITIDFHALGHKSVLTPRVLKGHVCVGRCLMPFVRGSNRGDFQEALAKASGEEPCCVPVARTGSIRFLLYNKTGHVFTRDLNNFYLQDCECRI